MILTWLRNRRPKSTTNTQGNRFHPSVETLDDRCLPAVQYGGTVSAAFVDPTPGAVVTGVGTNQFTWGDASGFGTGPNSLTFTSSTFRATVGQTFSLGTLRYFNGTTAVGTTPDSVDFQTQIQIQTPGGVTPQSQTLTFRFNLVSTTNVDGDPQASADYVFLPSFTVANPPVFTDASGNRFTVRLAGLGSLAGGGFKTLDQFHVYEGSTASAQLLARLIPDVDLSASVDSSHIVPLQAKDLHLLSFYGTEGVRVPVTVTNEGMSPAKGAVNIKVFLSTNPTLDDSAILSGSLVQQKLNLAGLAHQDFKVPIVVPKRLQAGQDYYVIAQVVPINILEKDSDKGKTVNNTAASSDQYEFLGTPTSNPAVFSNGIYFRFLRHFLQPKDPVGIPHPELFQRNQTTGFIAAFEGRKPYPYKVGGVGNTTIGIGMEIPTIVSAGLLPDLKAAVQTYTADNGDMSWANLTDSQFIQKLNNRAIAKSTKQILSFEDVDALFASLLVRYESQVRAILAQKGITTVAEGGYAWVALVDIQYNVKGGLNAFPSMLNALRDGDFLRAAFHLADSKRTTQLPGLTTRTEAEVQNFLLEAGGVGDIIPVP